MKKFISLALVLALAFCFSVTAFAEGSPDGVVVLPTNPENSPVQSITAAPEPTQDAMNAMANDASTDQWLDKVDATPVDNNMWFFLSFDVTSEGGQGDTLVIENLDALTGKIVLVYLDGQCVYAEYLTGNTLTVSFPHFSRVDLAYMDAEAKVPAPDNSGSTGSTSSTVTGKVCPSCGKTTVELVGGKFHCTSCEHTWTEYTGTASTAVAGGPTSPKTGDAGVAAALVVALMAGAGVCLFSRKENC